MRKSRAESRTMRRLVLVVAVVVATSACGAKREIEPSAGASRPPRAKSAITDAVDRDPTMFSLIQVGHFRSIADRIYVPVQYADDADGQIRAQVEAALRSLAEDFGTPFYPQPIGANDELRCYMAQVAAPLDGEPAVSIARYRVYYENMGPGVLVFEYARPSGEFVLQRVSYGLDTTATDARERMIDALENMLIAIGGEGPNLRANLEASMPVQR